MEEKKVVQEELNEVSGGTHRPGPTFPKPGPTIPGPRPIPNPIDPNHRPDPTKPIEHIPGTPRFDNGEEGEETTTV